MHKKIIVTNNLHTYSSSDEFSGCRGKEAGMVHVCGVCTGDSICAYYQILKIRPGPAS